MQGALIFFCCPKVNRKRRETWDRIPNASFDFYEHIRHCLYEMSPRRVAVSNRRPVSVIIHSSRTRPCFAFVMKAFHWPRRNFAFSWDLMQRMYFVFEKTTGSNLTLESMQTCFFLRLRLLLVLFRFFWHLYTEGTFICFIHIICERVAKISIDSFMIVDNGFMTLSFKTSCESENTRYK